jgi:hypothetical protein
MEGIFKAIFEPNDFCGARIQPKYGNVAGKTPERRPGTAVGKIAAVARKKLQIIVQPSWTLRQASKIRERL